MDNKSQQRPCSVWRATFQCDLPSDCQSPGYLSISFWSNSQRTVGLKLEDIWPGWTGQCWPILLNPQSGFSKYSSALNSCCFFKLATTLLVSRRPSCFESFQVSPPRIQATSLPSLVSSIPQEDIIPRSSYCSCSGLLSGIAAYSPYTGSAGQGGSLQLRRPPSPPSSPYSRNAFHKTKCNKSPEKKGPKMPNIISTKCLRVGMCHRDPKPRNFRLHWMLIWNHLNVKWKIVHNNILLCNRRRLGGSVILYVLKIRNQSTWTCLRN